MIRTDFKNVIDLLDYFQDDKKCKAFLVQQRWNGKPVCPHCGHNQKIYVTNRGYRCSAKKCGKKFSVTVGTIFENSKIPLRLWFAAIFFTTSEKKGLSSLQLSRRIGVTQKTAWFMTHRIRHMVQENEPQMLSGVVEADETYVGGKEKNKHRNKRAKKTEGRSTKVKTAVLGLMQRGGKVIAIPIPNATKPAIKPIVLKIVEHGSVLCTDEYKVYDFAPKYYKHEMVIHSKGEYVSGNAHTNTIEGFWGIFKRGVIGVYHNVSRKYMSAYCNEFAYRYNTRKQTDRERFFDTISKSGNFKLSYKQLKAKEPWQRN